MTNNITTPALLGVSEIAAYLSVSDRAVRDLVSRRQIPVIKIGQRIRVRQADLDAYLAANTREAAR